jgi:hypothetical protein
MRFSFLIASKRNYDSYAKKVVDSIFEQYRNRDDYEVVVCHPNIINDDRVIFVEDDQMIGSSYAFNLAYSKSIGDYVSVCVDDGIMQGDLIGAADFLESDIFTNRKIKITTLPASNGNDTIKFESRTALYDQRANRLLQLTDSFTEVYPFVVMCFPVIARESVENHLGGYIFHPRIKNCGDWWLGAYLYINGEEGIQYNDARFHITKNNDFHYDIVFQDYRCAFGGEAWINTYRLMKFYKPNDPYVYDTEDDFITEEYLTTLAEFYL